jgi:hypothetical protein
MIRASKKQGETDFQVDRLEQLNLKLQKKAESMSMLLSIYKSEKSSMIDKFAIIEKVMHMIEGKNGLIKLSNCTFTEK